MTEINPAPAKSNKFALLMVFLVVFIDLLGFGIVLPLLPIYGDQYVARVLPAWCLGNWHSSFSRGWWDCCIPVWLADDL